MRYALRKSIGDKYDKNNFVSYFMGCYKKLFFSFVVIFSSMVCSFYGENFLGAN